MGARSYKKENHYHSRRLTQYFAKSSANFRQDNFNHQPFHDFTNSS
jgi:hypothetical protein